MNFLIGEEKNNVKHYTTQLFRTIIMIHYESCNFSSNQFFVYRAGRRVKYLDEMKELLIELELDDQVHTRAMNLSGGMKRKLRYRFMCVYNRCS